MQIRVHLDRDAARRLRERAQRDLPRSRRQLVEESLTSALQQIIETHPVETGRSRAAWEAALSQATAGGASSEGGPPRGRAGGSREGRLTVYDGGDITEASATNSVAYVPFIEYGTRRSAPRAIVRRALARLVQRIRRGFRPER